MQLPHIFGKKPEEQPPDEERMPDEEIEEESAEPIEEITPAQPTQAPISRIDKLLTPENQIELFGDMIEPKIAELEADINRDLILTKTDEKTRLMIDQILSFANVLSKYANLKKAHQYFLFKAYVIINSLRSDRGFTFEGITSATARYKVMKEPQKPRGLFRR
jgi:hypothetical protein